MPSVLTTQVIDPRYVSGMDEVRRKLQAVPDKIKKEALKRGTLAGAEVIAEAARLRLPERGSKGKGYTRTGKLRASVRGKVLGVGKDDRGDPTQYSGVVEIAKKPKGYRGQNPRKYAHLVEFGAKPHGKHPGFPGQHPLEKAFDATAEQALSTMLKAIEQDLDAAIARVAGSGKTTS